MIGFQGIYPDIMEYRSSHIWDGFVYPMANYICLENKYLSDDFCRCKGIGQITLRIVRNRRRWKKMFNFFSWGNKLYLCMSSIYCTSLISLTSRIWIDFFLNFASRKCLIFKFCKTIMSVWLSIYLERHREKESGEI